MKYSNLHTHSVYSDGAHTPRQIIEQAIQNDMTAIGISDHSYTFFDTRYCIDEAKNGEYISELRALKDEYKGRIEVLVGIELDAYSSGYNRADFDYIIGSCHYLNFGGNYVSVDSSLVGVKDAIEKYCDGDSMRFAMKYFDTYTERICEMRPDILGHIDLVSKLGVVDESSEIYRKRAVETLCDSLSACDIIEMNTGAISRGYKKLPYPADFLLREIKEIKDKKKHIILSSDSHSKETLTFYFDECLNILRANGIKSVVTYSNGAFEEVSI